MTKINKKIAIYPGTFDPPTYGHLDIIERIVKLFDEIIVAIGEAPGKNLLFSYQERLIMLKELTKKYKNVYVDKIEGLLVEYAKIKKAQYIIRGLRALSDFEYEIEMALFNKKMFPEIETIFLMTQEKYLYISSSLVKEVARLSGNVSCFVPPIVEEMLNKKIKKS